MKIAVLALGSLAADPAPQLDCPLPPIEFTWNNTSKEKLILALCDEDWVRNVWTRWGLSTLDDLKQAHQVLADREGIDEYWVSFLTLSATSVIGKRRYYLHNPQWNNDLEERLKRWERDNQFGAIIWRDWPDDVAILGGGVFKHAQRDT